MASLCFRTTDSSSLRACEVWDRNIFVPCLWCLVTKPLIMGGFQYLGQRRHIAASFSTMERATCHYHCYLVCSKPARHAGTESCGGFPLNEMKSCLNIAAALTPSELCIFKTGRGGKKKAGGKHTTSSVINAG